MRIVAIILAVPVFLQLGACNILHVDALTRSNQPLCSDAKVLQRNERNWALCQTENSARADETSPLRSADSARNPTPVFSAREVIGKGELPGVEGGKTFVGIAISGGGSRAANFSLATLLELGSAGLLDHVTAISSVSGGSLTNAYYSLHSGDDLWQAATGKSPAENAKAREFLKEHFRRDLQNEWEGRWLSPWNVARYWLTPYDRSDIMKDVIDKFLEPIPGCASPASGANGDHIRFTQMGSICDGATARGLPRTYFNATTIDGRNFVFSEERFFDLGSRLDSFPVADAVMASAAFPGGFNKVTLERYRSLDETPTSPQSNIRQQRSGDTASKATHAWYLTAVDDIGFDEALEKLNLPDADPRREQGSPLEPGRSLYVHLMDGGASDNLGVRTLIRTMQASEERIDHCALILIDSYTDPLDRKWSRLEPALGIFEDDPRAFTDHFVDSSAVTAFDTLLSNNRENMLRELDYPGERAGQRAYWVAQPLLHRYVRTQENKNLSCDIWHLSFQRLNYLPENACAKAIERRRMARLANETVTAFRLDSPINHNAADLQNNLFKVAQCLVNSDSALEPAAQAANQPAAEKSPAARRPVREMLGERFSGWGIGSR